MLKYILGVAVHHLRYIFVVRWRRKYVSSVAVGQKPQPVQTKTRGINNQTDFM